MISFFLGQVKGLFLERSPFPVLKMVKFRGSYTPFDFSKFRIVFQKFLLLFVIIFGLFNGSFTTLSFSFMGNFLQKEFFTLAANSFRSSFAVGNSKPTPRHPILTLRNSVSTPHPELTSISLSAHNWGTPHELRFPLSSIFSVGDVIDERYCYFSSHIQTSISNDQPFSDSPTFFGWPSPHSDSLVGIYLPSPTKIQYLVVCRNSLFRQTQDQQSNIDIISASICFHLPPLRGKHFWNFTFPTIFNASNQLSSITWRSTPQGFPRSHVHHLRSATRIDHKHYNGTPTGSNTVGWSDIIDLTHGETPTHKESFRASRSSRSSWNRASRSSLAHISPPASPTTLPWASLPPKGRDAAKFFGSTHSDSRLHIQPLAPAPTSPPTVQSRHPAPLTATVHSTTALMLPTSSRPLLHLVDTHLSAVAHVLETLLGFDLLGLQPFALLWKASTTLTGWGNLPSTTTRRTFSTSRPSTPLLVLLLLLCCCAVPTLGSTSADLMHVVKALRRLEGLHKTVFLLAQTRIGRISGVWGTTKYARYLSLAILRWGKAALKTALETPTQAKAPPPTDDASASTLPPAELFTPRRSSRRRPRPRKIRSNASRKAPRRNRTSSPTVAKTVTPVTITPVTTTPTDLLTTTADDPSDIHTVPVPPPACPIKEEPPPPSSGPPTDERDLFQEGRGPTFGNLFFAGAAALAGLLNCMGKPDSPPRMDSYTEEPGRPLQLPALRGGRPRSHIFDGRSGSTWTARIEFARRDATALTAELDRLSAAIEIGKVDSATFWFRTVSELETAALDPARTLALNIARRKWIRGQLQRLLKDTTTALKAEGDETAGEAAEAAALDRARRRRFAQACLRLDEQERLRHAEERRQLHRWNRLERRRIWE